MDVKTKSLQGVEGLFNIHIDYFDILKRLVQLVRLDILNRMDNFQPF